LYEAWVYSKRDGKKIRKSFPTLAAAKGWRTDALKAVKDKRLRAPSSRTLRQEVEDWLAGARRGRILNKRERPYKPAVIREYERSLRLRVLPVLGDRKLADVDLADLLELKEELLGAGCSGSVIRNSFVPLQAIYRRARRNGGVPINPTVDLGLPTSGVRERAVAPREGAELIALLPSSEQALWATALYAGLRRGELRGLRRNDVDLEAGVIRVERGWDDKDGAIEPKSRAGTRNVFVLETLRPFIEPLAAGTNDPAALFFGLTDSTPFEPKNVARKAKAAWAAENKRRIENAAEHGGKPVLVEPITLHECRHSFSTFLDHAGISPSRADRYMGHSDGSVANRYRHQLASQLAEDARLVDRYLAGTNGGNVVALAAAG
jgi:integrase